MNIDKNYIINVVKLFRPKYYNILTRLLILTGISLLTKPLWIEILNLFSDKFQFLPIGKYDLLIGIIIIIIALMYNTINRIIDLKLDKSKEPAFKMTEYKSFSNFGELCQEILPILKDNEYIFKTVGPNSGCEEIGPLRRDLTIWENLKKEVIIPNNEAIEKLIIQNRDVIPTKYENDFNAMLLHISAFKEHIKNKNFDYSEHQFPKTFPSIILEHCFQASLSDKKLSKKIDWLSKKIKGLNIFEWYIFGSVVLTPSKANDVDIVILLEKETNLQELNKKIEDLKFDFKIKFRLPLQTTIFEFSDKKDYFSFIEQNQFKIKK